VHSQNEKLLNTGEPKYKRPYDEIDFTTYAISL